MSSEIRLGLAALILTGCFSTAGLAAILAGRNGNEHNIENFMNDKSAVIVTGSSKYMEFAKIKKITPDNGGLPFLDIQVLNRMGIVQSIFNTDQGESITNISWSPTGQLYFLYSHPGEGEAASGGFAKQQFGVNGNDQTDFVIYDPKTNKYAIEQLVNSRDVMKGAWTGDGKFVFMSIDPINNKPTVTVLDPNN